MLPVDSDTVEIERRLYRDGGSEYLINGKTARLKDIREMFMDTGVGADAYSIIEQGKVDAMLLASPQERRIIFEEAAGIAKYKQRRIEAQRRLDRAEANLKTAKDQLESTERRLRLVKGQAAKARKFQEFDSELRAWRLALAFDQYDLLLERIEGLTSQQQGLSQQRDQAHATLADLEQRKQEAELRRHELSEQVRRLESERMQAAHARQQSEQRKAMLERLVEQTRRESETDQTTLAELTQRVTGTDEAITDHREQVAALTEQLSESERALQEAAQARAKASEQLGDKQRLATEKANAAARIERERLQMLAVVEGESKRALSLREQLEKLAGSVDRINRDKAGVIEQQQAAEREATTLREQVGILEGSLREVESLLSERDEDRRARAQAIAQMDQEFVRVESRRGTLEEMAEQRVGFAEAVRRAMQMKAKPAKDTETNPMANPWAGVIAPLADLIEIKPDLDPAAASALELALGEDLQALIVANLGRVPAAEALGPVGGRLAFLTLEEHHHGEQRRATEEGTEQESSDENGVGTFHALVEAITAQGQSDVQGPDAARARVVRLRGLVCAREGEHRAKVDALLDRLLARTLLVSDLDAAELLRAGMSGADANQARFVTRQGEVLDPQRRVRSGPTTEPNEKASDKSAGALGLLRRRAELEQLAAKASTLSSQLASMREALAAVDSEAGQLSQRASALRAELSQKNKALASQTGTIERLSYDLTRLDRELARVVQEQEQHTSRLTKIDGEVTTLAAKIASLARLGEEESLAATSLADELRTLQAAVDASTEQVTGAKVQVSRLSEQLSSEKRELARVESIRDDLSRRTRDLSQRMTHHESRLAEHAVAINEAIVIIQNATAGGETLAAELSQASDALSGATSEAQQLGEAVASARQNASHAERDFHSIELSRRELEVKRETIEERTLQEANIDLRAEHAAYREMLVPVTMDVLVDDPEGAAAGAVVATTFEIARPNHDEAQRAIDDLRSHIKKLGSVNMEALDEEKTLEGQNEQLVKQVADIEQAREQLTQLITQLNDVSRDRFASIFSTIQQQFGGEHGMYRKLFGGGRAEVRLMPLIKEVEQPDGSIQKVETDEIDVLESGVEVIAKPPGKEPRSISQLSGGEKTLTAVALLMSIFRSKPSCFCVLDEVDAALDESNVGRFNNCVRDFTDLSRFIVITHNKRTMQNADHLYGITQQEKGVSTRVSVRFEQVGKDGKITVKGDANTSKEAPTPQDASKPAASPGAEVEAKPADSPEGLSAESAVAVATVTATPRKARKPKVQASEQVTPAETVASPTQPVSEVMPPEPVLEPAPAPVAAPAAIEPPLIEVVAPAPAERVAEPAAEPVVHIAPVGIGESPEQQTTLGMSPLKRAMARLRESMGGSGK
jgi:chromosome segregation protein